MVLDTIGGPTYILNFCDAPIIVNATSQEFYKQPMFYILGHFAKFLPRDSYRIDFVSSSNVSLTAFKRPDDGTVVIILNKYVLEVRFHYVWINNNFFKGGNGYWNSFGG